MEEMLEFIKGSVENSENMELHEKISIFRHIRKTYVNYLLFSDTKPDLYPS